MPTKKEEKNKPRDILDDVRRNESRIKRALFLSHFSCMKEMAHQRLCLQEELRATCEQLGLSKDDTKRVIDFINESDDVRLTESDIEDVAEKVRDTLSDSRQDLVKELEKQPLVQRYPLTEAIGQTVVGFDYDYDDNGSITSTHAVYNVVSGTDGTSADTVNLNNGSSELSLKL